MRELRGQAAVVLAVLGSAVLRDAQAPHLSQCDPPRPPTMGIRLTRNTVAQAGLLASRHSGRSDRDERSIARLISRSFVGLASTGIGWTSRSNLLPFLTIQYAIGTVIWVALLLASANDGLALNISSGPWPSTDRPGPNGAQVFVVKDRNTFNLSGANVRIGQIEPGEPRATHNMLGVANVTLRGVGSANSNHATGVAGILIGRPFTPGGQPQITGVASGATLFSTGYTRFQRPANAADFVGGVNFMTGNNVNAVNMSSGFFDAANRFIIGENGSGVEALIVDRTVRERDIVWVQAAGNCGAAAPLCSRAGARTIIVPGDAYNSITVGRTGQNAAGNASEDYTRVGNPSSRGPTGDGRHKPDVVAPGGLILMPSGGNNTDFQTDSGTSFAAPHVAGTAALLRQYATQQGLGTGHLLQKVTILNGASKHVRDPANGDRSWPAAYAAQNPDPLNATVPLDNAMGVGQLNALAAVRQYRPGSRSDVGLQSSTVGAGGTNTFNLFVGRQPLTQGSLVTATLTWDRTVTLNAGADPTMAGSYTVTPLPNLNLELVNRATGVVARSNSTLDNVEHIYFNVPATGNYDLRVINRGATASTYALAWTSGTSEGPAFSVDGGRFNPQRNDRTILPMPAEGVMAPIAGRFPNDVNALGSAGPANFATEGEIFVSGLDGTNMQRLSGALGTMSRVGPHNAPPAAISLLESTRRGVLGLQPNDNISGLSWGTDGTLDPRTGRPSASVLLFSVDTLAVGVSGTDVRFQAVDSPPLVGPIPAPFPQNVPGGAPGGEAAGDIFKSQRLDPFGKYASPLLAPADPGKNLLFVDEAQLGLQAPRNRGSLLSTAGEDDLDALEMDSVFSVDFNGDGIPDRPVFFELDRFSPSVSPGNGCSVPTSDDIFVTRVPFSFSIFADGVCDINLRSNDVIDALVLSDVDRIGFLDPGIDEALFSLDPFSVGGGVSAAAVYYTDFIRPFLPRLDWKLGGSLFASADSLGLEFIDNLDALDIRRTVPEPSSLVLLGVGLALTILRRKNR
jgi:subtilisin family serine protease